MKIPRFIRCHYRSRWEGMVIDWQKRKDIAPLFLVMVLRDKNGAVPRKRMFKLLDASWAEAINKIDTSGINPDWFKNLPRITK